MEDILVGGRAEKKTLPATTMMKILLEPSKLWLMTKARLGFIYLKRTDLSAVTLPAL